MGSFGERLRREREMRGIGLDEIAAATKISTRNLRALEDEKFNQLPGGIFNKGFVRAYAKFLGIDQDQIVAEYEAASHDTESAREQKLQEDFAKAEFRKKPDNQEISLEPKSQWGTIAVIVLIAAVGYGGYSYYQRRKLEKLQQPTPLPAITQPTRQTPPPPATAPPVESASKTAAGTEPSTVTTPANAAPAQPQSALPDTTKTVSAPTETKPATQKSETSTTPTNPKPITDQNENASASTPIQLKIKINKESWVSIKADGRTLVNGTLSPGTEKTYKANERIEMILGNSGGVEVSYNGKPVENVNLGQDVRKMTFTPSGYQ